VLVNNRQKKTLQNVQMLIVSAVKICKRCLQPTSASGELTQTKTPWAVAPKWKLLATCRCRHWKHDSCESRGRGTSHS